MNDLRVGDEISCRFGFGKLFRHVGICADFHPITGEPLIAHNSRDFGGVRVSSIREFSDGNAVSVRSQKSPRRPALIQQMIFRLIGKPYDPVNYNCEHFVSEVLGYHPHSPQAAFWIGTGLIGGAALLAVASRR